MKKAILTILALFAFAGHAQEKAEAEVYAEALVAKAEKQPLVLASLSQQSRVHALQTDDKVAPLPYVTSVRKRELTVNERLALQAGRSYYKAPDAGFQLQTKRFFDCTKETLSVDVWLVSKHASKQRNKKLQEQNRGIGFVYSCDNWSAGLDRMVNSNNGTALVLSLVWSARVLELGPVFLNGSLGYARVSYGVPKYNATLYDNSKIGFVGIGLTQWPEFTLNIAPVPKVAGKAHIAWFKYEVYSFK